MIFLRKFNEHASYEAEINRGGVDFKIPNVSYCKNVDDVHFNPYNTVEFYVGKITTPQTVKIYTDSSTSIPIQVSEGNKWYSYVLPKDKGLYKIEGNSVKKVAIKSNISYEPIYQPPFIYGTIIPYLTVEASFKGSNSNTSKVTDMGLMFDGCSGLTSLDLSGWDTSNVTNMFNMFSFCHKLTSLDLSSFDTSNVTNMESMFEGCVGLTELDVSSFNTSNVIYMNGMFNGCNSLTSLTLSNFDTSNVTNMKEMFRGCGNLKTITMIGCGQTTIDKIEAQLTKDNITGFTIVTK